AEAVKLASRYKIGPMFTPPVVSNFEGPLATLTAATAGGGSNWPGGSYDPETHFAYVSSQTTVTAIGLVPGGTRSDMTYISGQARAPDAPAGAAPAGGGRGGRGAAAAAPAAAGAAPAAAA